MPTDRSGIMYSVLRTSYGVRDTDTELSGSLELDLRPWLVSRALRASAGPFQGLSWAARAFNKLHNSYYSADNLKSRNIRLSPCRWSGIGFWRTAKQAGRVTLKSRCHLTFDKLLGTGKLESPRLLTPYFVQIVENTLSVRRRLQADKGHIASE